MRTRPSGPRPHHIKCESGKHGEEGATNLAKPPILIAQAKNA